MRLPISPRQIFGQAREPRQFGILHINRRNLAIGAMAFAGTMTSIPTLPASAEIVHADVIDAVLQKYTAPDAPALVVPERELYTVTVFSVVQAPLAMSSISADFGHRRAPCRGCTSDHQGVDFTPGAGTSIASIADGVVVEAASSSSGLGVHVKIDHVIDGVHYTSVYGHMQYGSLGLSVGQSVARGQVIGRVGNTGASTGAHLHFEIRPGGGDAIDPLAWLRAHVNA